MNRPQKSYLKKTAFFTVILIPFLLITLWEYGDRVSAKTQDTYKNLEVFSNVLSIIQNNYVEEVDAQKLIEGAINGMLTSLDPHSSYMKPDSFKELEVETKGSFSGIGIEISMKDGVLTVVSPIEGTPAFKKGLQAGDKIIKIEQEYTKEMTLMEAVKRLRGKKGTEVTISIFREGWNDLKEVTIVRDIIPIHSVKAKFIKPGYAYLRISNFQSKTTKDLKDALNKLTGEKEIAGLILDLRNNPGGLLDQAVKVCDIFLEDGTIVSTQGRLKDQNMIFKAHSGASYLGPMVVLVNEGSASASEIVAGAMKDHKRALILGAQTFGKGSVQTIIPMNNGAGLRLTTARYYTPNGISIQAKGITPDIVVATRLLQKEEKKPSKKRHKFLREKDLRHHITNGDEPEEEDEVNDSAPDTSMDDNDSSQNNGTKEDENDRLLAMDPQLNTALMILEGLHVLGAN